MENKLQIKRSNQLMNATNSLPKNPLKLWLLSIADIKWLNENKVEIDERGRVITKLGFDLLKTYIPEIMNQRNYKQDLKKYAKVLLDNQVGVVEESKNGDWTMIGAYATKAGYINNEFVITHNIDVIDLIDSNNKFTEYYFEKIKSLKSNHQIKMYDLCIQPMNLSKKRKESIEYLRGYFNTKNQFKSNGSFVRNIIQTTINAINNNKNTDISIQIKTIKTGRKITHIEFIMQHKRLNGLEDIQFQYNDLKAILTSIGISSKKISFIAKYSVYSIIKAAKYTKKLINKNSIIKTPEACFIGSLEKMGNINMSKADTVTNFLELLSIESQQALRKEFHDQLSMYEKTTYASIVQEKNQIKKTALETQQNQHYRKWIYETKITQHSLTVK